MHAVHKRGETNREAEFEDLRLVETRRKRVPHRVIAREVACHRIGVTQYESIRFVEDLCLLPIVQPRQLFVAKADARTERKMRGHSVMAVVELRGAKVGEFAQPWGKGVRAVQRANHRHKAAQKALVICNEPSHVQLMRGIAHRLEKRAHTRRGVFVVNQWDTCHARILPPGGECHESRSRGGLAVAGLAAPALRCAQPENRSISLEATLDAVARTPKQ